MAVIGGIILILIVAIILWIALMGKFEKIGKKITNRINKTFKEEKGEK